MRFGLKKIHHLIRYFLFLAVLAFVGYIKNLNDSVFFFLMGPPIYLAYGLRTSIEQFARVPHSEPLNHYAFLLPVSLVYFGFLGLQLKLLFNERGFVRTTSLFALVGFLIFLHYWCRENLLAYFTAHI